MRPSEKIIQDLRNDPINVTDEEIRRIFTAIGEIREEYSEGTIQRHILDERLRLVVKEGLRRGIIEERTEN